MYRYIMYVLYVNWLRVSSVIGTLVPYLQIYLQGSIEINGEWWPYTGMEFFLVFVHANLISLRIGYTCTLFEDVVSPLITPDFVGASIFPQVGLWISL